MTAIPEESDPPSAIVIDHGSFSVKCGFGGEEAPSTNLLALHPDFPHETDHVTYSGNYRFVEEGASLIPEGYSKCSVINEGVVQNWDCLEALWEKFLVETEVDCSEKPIIVMSAMSNNCATSTSKFCELAFEKFGFDKLCISTPEPMALLGTGRFTGVVTNIGYDYCVSRPIVNALNSFKKDLESQSDDHVEIFPVKVGGRHVSERIKKELMTTHNMENNSTLDETVEDIKRKHCSVSGWGSDCHITSSDTLYVLPDNTTISLPSEMLRDCAEILFSTRDEENGLTLVEALCRSVLRSVIQHGYSSSMMWDNMVLYGGTSLIRGLDGRINQDVFMISDPGAKFRTIAVPERGYLPWFGASIFSSISVFEDYGLSKLNFEEVGSTAMKIL